MGTASDSASRVAIELDREAYYATFFYFTDIAEGTSLNRHLVAAVRARQNADQAGLERSNMRGLGGWHSRGDLHRDAAFHELTASIHGAGEQIAADLNYDPDHPLTIDTMWAIVNPPGAFNRCHIHPGYLWSGVYYIQAPAQSGRISFTDPRTMHLMHEPRYAPGKSRKVENWTDVFYDPVPGRLILFPSWIYHAVEPNLCTRKGECADRISVSFNLLQRPADSQHNGAPASPEAPLDRGG